jgi:hypothetical protein
MSALLADAEDLSGMSDIAEAMLFSDQLGPFFDSTTLNFNGLTSALAD